MKTFQNEVGEWALKTFPASTLKSKALHLKKEANELVRATSSSNIENLKEECADCLILLSNIAYFAGFDLLEQGKLKMVINKKRKWKEPDKNGIVEHV